MLLRFRKFFFLCSHFVVRGNIRSLSVTSLNHPDDGFTRSIYCKPEIKEVIRDGKVIKISTGLVDQSLEAPDDQWLDLLAKVTYKHDLDVKALTAWLKERQKNRNKLRQIVSNDAIQHLGLDLAVAHMVCGIGGRVKFIDNPKWFYRYAFADPGLPRRYVGDLKLESLDLSGTNVVYEGFELLPQLRDLRHLRLRRCLHVDDFCLSRVGRISSLELLDIGECPRLTSKGLATLTQLKNLRYLLLNNNPLMDNKELVCLLLEDHLPKVIIAGVNYLEALPEESRKRICALIAAESDTRLGNQSAVVDHEKYTEFEDVSKQDYS